MQRVVSAPSQRLGHFCGDIGLFCGYIVLFCGDTGLFCGDTGLFCGDTGLFCRDVSRCSGMERVVSVSAYCEAQTLALRYGVLLRRYRAFAEM